MASVLDRLGDNSPLYETLRRLAHARLASCPPGATFQPTELVHEAFIRLAEFEGRGNVLELKDADHLAAIAATTIRRVVIDSIRRRDAKGRAMMIVAVGGESQQTSPMESFDALALNDAIEQLERSDPGAARIIELRFFGGLTMAQAADALNIPFAQADREWRYARAWIARRLRGEAQPIRD